MEEAGSLLGHVAPVYPAWYLELPTIQHWHPLKEPTYMGEQIGPQSECVCVCVHVCARVCVSVCVRERVCVCTRAPTMLTLL